MALSMHRSLILAKAVASATLMGAFTSELYIQIWLLRRFSPGTVVTPFGRDEPLSVLENIIDTTLSVRFSLPFAFVTAVLVTLLCFTAYVRVPRLRAVPTLVSVLLGTSVGAIVDMSMLWLRSRGIAESAYAFLLGASAIGAFAAPCIALGLGRADEHGGNGPNKTMEPTR